MSIYDGFKNVAFLTETKNLNLVSILGIILGSIDKAVELIRRILDKGETTMKQIAIYLAGKRIILVNEKGNVDYLKYFFEKHKNHKVLFVGYKSEKKYHSLVKRRLWLPHCSGQAYSQKYLECYSSYFEHSYRGENNNSQFPNNLKISDFCL